MSESYSKIVIRLMDYFETGDERIKTDLSKIFPGGKKKWPTNRPRRRKVKQRVRVRNKMACQGICIRHQAVKGFRGHHYLNGEKRCQVCCIFIKWNNDFCPCCGCRLRTRPRSSQYKMKWHEMIITRWLLIYQRRKQLKCNVCGHKERQHRFAHDLCVVKGCDCSKPGWLRWLIIHQVRRNVYVVIPFYIILPIRIFMTICSVVYFT